MALAVGAIIAMTAFQDDNWSLGPIIYISTLLSE
jgi:hypothetical protein